MENVGVIVMLPNGLPINCLILVGQCNKPGGRSSKVKKG